MRTLPQTHWPCRAVAGGFRILPTAAVFTADLDCHDPAGLPDGGGSKGLYLSSSVQYFLRGNESGGPARRELVEHGEQLGRIGSLRVIRIDFGIGDHTVALLDPVQNLAYHAHARDVELVMVDGQIRVEDHEAVSVDRLGVIDAATRASDLAWARFQKKYGGPMAKLSSG